MTTSSQPGSSRDRDPTKHMQGVETHAAAAGKAIVNETTVVGGELSYDEERAYLADMWHGLVTASGAAVARRESRSNVPKQESRDPDTHVGFDNVSPRLYADVRGFVEKYRPPANEGNEGFIGEQNLVVLSTPSASPVRHVLLRAVDKVRFDMTQEHKKAGMAIDKYTPLISACAAIREGVRQCMPDDGNERRLFELDGIVNDIMPEVEAAYELQRQVNKFRKGESAGTLYSEDERRKQGDRIADLLGFSRILETLFTSTEDPGERVAVEIGIRMRALQIDKAKDRESKAKRMLAHADGASEQESNEIRLHTYIDGLLHGIKLEYAAYDALKKYLAEYGSDTRWSVRRTEVRRADMRRNQRYGTGAFVIVDDKEYPLDFKASETFWRQPGYRPIPGLPPEMSEMLALKTAITSEHYDAHVFGEDVMVANPEHVRMGGGLVQGSIVQIPGNKLVLVDGWSLADGNAFAVAVLSAVLSRHSTLRARDEGVQQF